MEEIEKPIKERIPLPRPTSDFLKMFEIAKQLILKEHTASDQESGAGELNRDLENDGDGHEEHGEKSINLDKLSDEESKDN